MRNLSYRSDSEPLSRERVLQATLDFIDEHGVEALSLRKLARSLGVFPTAIYWHVEDRDGLIAGAVQLALSGITERLKSGSWQERLRSVMCEFRQRLRKHPNLSSVVSREMFYNSRLDQQLMEYIAAALEEAGFRNAQLGDAFNVVIAGMCGFSTLEVAPEPVNARESPGQFFEERIGALSREKAPTLLRNLDGMKEVAFVFRWPRGKKRPLHSGFETWVNVILAGLEIKAEGIKKTHMAAEATQG